MHLSISNSNKKTSWLTTWIVAFSICLIFLTGYELFLKNRGFEPSIEDNITLWSWYRSHINHKNDLVIIGASRSQLDLNIPYLKKKFSQNHITQLSINGHYPVATLKALANDKSFKGTLIVSLNAQALEKIYFDMQAHYNNFYQQKSHFYNSFDSYVHAFLQSKFRFLHPLLGLEQIINHYQTNKRFINDLYTTAHLNRSVAADYSKTNTEALIKHFVTEKENNYLKQTPSKPQLWIKNLVEIRTYVKSIEERGGTVVFIRFPTDKGHWKLDELYYPRNEYWDKIKGIKKAHFNDVYGLNQFNLPDSSHLDKKDTEAFTSLLFNYLIENNFINQNIKKPE